MVRVQHFNESLEKTFKNLGVEIERQKNNPETAERSEHEMVKNAIQSVVKTSTPQTDENTIPSEEKKESDLPTYLSAKDNPDVAREVEALVSVAFEKGIVEAVSKAKKHSPFIEDALHDALADKVLPELKKRGML